MSEWRARCDGFNTQSVGWMDDLQFYVLSTVFQSYQDDGHMIMKGCMHWTSVYSWEDFALSMTRTRDHQISRPSLNPLSNCGSYLVLTHTFWLLIMKSLLWPFPMIPPSPLHGFKKGSSPTSQLPVLTGDNHVTCGQLSKPDVATLSYRRSHYWGRNERWVTVVFVQFSVFCVN